MWIVSEDLAFDENGFESRRFDIVWSEDSLEDTSVMVTEDLFYCGCPLNLLVICN